MVKIKPLRPLAIESYSEIPQLGRFAIRDMGSTIAVGVVKQVTEKAQLSEKKA
jgi:elongation factor 1-alpha